jgi:flagellar hook-basal body complex protein FliE
MQMIPALGSVGNSHSSGSALSIPLSSGQHVSNLKREEPFGDLLKDTVGGVNHLEVEAKNAVLGLMTGTGVDVHQAMIASEKASMAFEMVLAVRNKAIQSYQSVMSMQF